MFYLMMEDDYERFSWAIRSLRGLRNEVRKKRLEIYEVFDLEEIPTYKDTKPCVVLLGATKAWLREHIHKAEQLFIYPIVLSNIHPSEVNGCYSLVTMDLGKTVRTAYDYLSSIGCKRVALYGVNPDSLSDSWRVRGFQASNGSSQDVFPFLNSAESTFLPFYEQIHLYDGVICVNDYIAASLLLHLKKREEKLLDQIKLIGYGDLLISRIFSPSITSFSDSYEDFGSIALELYSMLQKKNFNFTAHFVLESKLIIRETTKNRPYNYSKRNTLDKQSYSNRFFEDKEMVHMGLLEQLMKQCDEIDFQILQYLNRGDTYEQISEKCFLSKTATKYRVKIMRDICGCESRKKLEAFIAPLFE